MGGKKKFCICVFETIDFTSSKYLFQLEHNGGLNKLLGEKKLNCLVSFKKLFQDNGGLNQLLGANFCNNFAEDASANFFNL